ncbi:TIGR03546 family protein [Aliidiomarina halalkaliphila]|uniref:TIGR03546 family protein n=1 Tax=Aliidiomarina halalkaliphila TaxID=2593535 RepID=A0A552X0K4_9GAMM|nr:TIGR03546 family protein [Aliidiomarina halalkaliphila]TRW48113.1 TIGR03546 family protein [Aliidiomarina halalkaliphila]
MLTMLARLLKALNAESSPWALAWAFVLGMFMGLTPLFSLHNIFILFFALSFRINLTGFILAFAVFSGIAYLLDPMFNFIGESLLAASSLEGLWVTLYEIPLARLFQYNQTITLGSFVFCVLFAPIWLLLSHRLILMYRGRVMVWFGKLRLVQIVKSTKFFAAYERVSGLRGGY